MKVKKNSTHRVLCPEGNHITILTQILDWGTQTDSFGKRRKVELIWETPEELHVFNEERGEEPFIIDRKFALTIGKNSALADALVGLTGKSIDNDEIDLEEYLGTVGMINIKHKEDGPRYIYYPAESTEEAREDMLAHVVRTYFAGSPEQAVTALLRMSDVDIEDAEVKRLRETIRRARQSGR